MRSPILFGLCVAFVSACGGSENFPASPASPSLSPPTATAPATNLTMAGPDVVPTGASVKYDATATLSNGVTIYHASATWNTDNADVATIDINGVLTAQGPGTGTITATYRGATATATVRVSVGSKPFLGSANVVISFGPDPVPASLTPCPDFGERTPTWKFDEIFKETQGVGFTVQVETVNLYDADGVLLFHESSWQNYYFLPNSEFVEEFCTALEGGPSGFFEEILDGIDDKGNQLTFRSRLRLLPVGDASPNSSQ